jgi:hypothetical protein
MGGLLLKLSGDAGQDKFVVRHHFALSHALTCAHVYICHVQQVVMLLPWALPSLFLMLKAVMEDPVTCTYRSHYTTARVSDRCSHAIARS